MTKIPIVGPEEILSAEELHKRLIQRPKREKICHGLEKIVPKLKKEISKKNEILVPLEGLGKKLGLGALSDRHPITIYWDVRYCLWKDGIYVGSTKKDHKKMIIIRGRKSDDELHI